mmetsp:Transcript_7852/g.18025  ORF Transcript_7852/g.18025 Transcript_7852/m.18025 type:complete len:227 (-) Transcript_7852:699-1379(-)
MTPSPSRSILFHSSSSLLDRAARSSFFVHCRPFDAVRWTSGESWCCSQRSKSIGGWKLGIFSFWTSPEITSMNQSAGFSSAGILKPMLSKYPLAPCEDPRYTVRPPLPRRSTSSNRVKSEYRGWWITMMAVMPSSVSFLMEWITVRELVESKPLVGSSRNRRVGSAASSRPMFTRFLWPPLMPLFSTPPTMLFLMWSICITLRTSSTIASVRLGVRFGGPRSCAEK